MIPRRRVTELPDRSLWSRVPAVSVTPWEIRCRRNGPDLCPAAGPSELATDRLSQTGVAVLWRRNQPVTCDEARHDPRSARACNRLFTPRVYHAPIPTKLKSATVELGGVPAAEVEHGAVACRVAATEFEHTVGISEVCQTPKAPESGIGPNPGVLVHTSPRATGRVRVPLRVCSAPHARYRNARGGI